MHERLQGSGQEDREISWEACKAGGPKNTCMCTWKLGQAQKPLKSIGSLQSRKRSR